MQLVYDRRDFANVEKLRDERFKWLQELNAVELNHCNEKEEGYLFTYQLGEDHLLEQIRDRDKLHDRPDERAELVCLDDVLLKLSENEIDIRTPKTWVLEIDTEPPDDLEFPLFLRTRKSSWKRGGDQSKVNNKRELAEDSELLRRAFGWDTPIIARTWLNIGVAGAWMFGNVPQEVRIWVIRGEPVAWNFHYLHAVRYPEGFPPSSDELQLLKQMAAQVASPFKALLIAADFVRDIKGTWHFLEAGPGSIAGTSHESVFKYVANYLVERGYIITGDEVGGPL